MPSIQDLMKKELVVVGPDTSAQDAIRLLIDHKISGLPVVDAKRAIVGVLSEKDLMKVFYEGELTVGKLMTPDPVSFDVNAPLVDVVDTLMTHDFRRVLIHEHGKLVGLISRADLMPALLDGLLDRTSLKAPIR